MRPALPRGKKRLRYVDGFSLRYLTPDSYDIVMTSDGRTPALFVPTDEVWIDRRYRAETDFLLAILRVERQPRFRGQHYRAIRAALNRLLKKSAPPPFVVRTERRGGLKIRFVRGETVRQYLDPAFVFGGHDLVYGYIPTEEIWIDVRQDRREIGFTLMHELQERAFMARGLTYDEAHDTAIRSELFARARKFVR